MRKSTIFISAVLTTFTLVMLYRIVLAYSDNRNATETAAQPTFIPAPTLTEAAAPADVAIKPEQAAQLAAQVIGNPNLLSAESSTYNGVDAYIITFSNNDVVYVGLDGQILAVQVAPVVVNVAPPVNPNNSERVSRPSRGSHENGGGEHEDHDD